MRRSWRSLRLAAATLLARAAANTGLPRGHTLRTLEDAADTGRTAMRQDATVHERLRHELCAILITRGHKPFHLWATVALAGVACAKCKGRAAASSTATGSVGCPTMISL